MKKETNSILANSIKEYSEAISHHGINNKNTKKIKKKYRNVKDFLLYAESLEKLHKNLHPKDSWFDKIKHFYYGFLNWGK